MLTGILQISTTGYIHKKLYSWRPSLCSLTKNIGSKTYDQQYGNIFKNCGIATPRNIMPLLNVKEKFYSITLNGKKCKIMSFHDYILKKL